MSYNDKLKNSTIYKTGKIYYKDLNFPTSKQRRNSIILFVLMAIFTIYTKIILKAASFDVMMLFIIISLFTTLLLKIVSQSVYALNHYRLVAMIKFLNSICKLIIFISAFNLYYDTLNTAMLKICETTIMQVVSDLSNDVSKVMYFKELFNQYTLQVVSFIASIIVFIPVVLYLLVVYFKIMFKTFLLMIPAINIIYYLVWVFSNNKEFIEYVNDDNPLFCTKNYRIVDDKSYIVWNIILKLIIGGIPVFFSYFIIYNILKNILL